MKEEVEFPYEALKSLLPLAFEEDLGSGDITSQALIPESMHSHAVIVAKEPGVAAGLQVVKNVFEFNHCNGDFHQLAQEGKWVESGAELYTIYAPTRDILACERIILNFLQRMCGIATSSFQLQSLLKKTSIKILDTRKTLPGYRLLDKYAVRVGGSRNHRMGL
jgi:nicotinate-nucleotide pyrophosphorylase (carboxylating)